MPGAAKQTGKAKPNNTANATKPDEVPITQEKFDEIINKSKGDRPENVLEYLPEEYVKAHLAKFDDGAVRFTSKAKYEQYGTYGPNEGFVMPASEFNQLMKEANGDIRIVEKKLGLEDGYLSNSDCMAV